MFWCKKSLWNWNAVCQCRAEWIGAHRKLIGLFLATKQNRFCHISEGLFALTCSVLTLTCHRNMWALVQKRERSHFPHISCCPNSVCTKLMKQIIYQLQGNKQPNETRTQHSICHVNSRYFSQTTEVTTSVVCEHKVSLVCVLFLLFCKYKSSSEVCRLLHLLNQQLVSTGCSATELSSSKDLFSSLWDHL